MHSAWARHAPLAPQLYLYSSADALIPAAHVEAFMAQQARRGLRVEARRWEDSGHCEHLRRHPEEYTALVRRFVKRALAEEPPRSATAARSWAQHHEGL
jgi:pimeloyl-ACP methyl ester carboxylesterase